MTVIVHDHYKRNLCQITSYNYYTWVARSRSGSSSFTALALNKPSSSSSFSPSSSSSYRPPVSPAPRVYLYVYIMCIYVCIHTCIGACGSVHNTCRMASPREASQVAASLTCSLEE